MKKKPTDEEIREGNLLIDEYMGADAQRPRSTRATRRWSIQRNYLQI